MKEPIIFITKAYHHYETIRDVLQKHALNYPVYYGKDSESCLEIARELVEKGAKVLISTDYLCKIFMQELNVSVISIRRSGYSFVSRVAEELKTTDKIAILSRIGGYSFGIAAEEARLVNPEQVYTYEYSNENEVPRILKRLKASGFKSVICPSWVGPLVSDYGMKYAYILLPEPDILEAIQHAEFQLRVNQRQALSENLISNVLNLSSEGIAAIDENGNILDVNDYACSLLGVHRNDLLEKHYSQTVLVVFDRHGELSRHDEVQRSILTLHDQMLVYDIRAVMIDESLKAHLITFNSAQQIKETERSIRLKEMKKGSVAAATFTSIIGGSTAITQAVKRAKKYASVNSTVLITAPSGCGKELFAQSIHNASPRAKGPFVVINCAALPENLNRFMPEGIVAVDCWEAVRPIRELDALHCRVELIYDGGVTPETAQAVQDLFARQEIVIQKRTKRKAMADVDIRPLIRSLAFAVEGDALCIDATVAAQNPGLNPALLAVAVETCLPEHAPDFVRVQRLSLMDGQEMPFR